MVNLTKRKFSNGRKSRKNFSNCGSWKKVNNKNPMPSNKMYGGSPQSELVMNDTMKARVLNDYVTSPRIRQEGYSDAFPAAMCGGSPASDMVMENLNDMAKTDSYPPEPKVAGNMNSLKLYQTTGGALRQKRNHKKSHHRKSRTNKSRTNKRNGRSKKSRNNKRNNRNRIMRGGGSAWLNSQNSLGNINAPEQPASWVSQFSQSTATSRDMLMNPPTLGLAGSGYPMGSLEGANVRMTGAPL
jgi:hypothetical protein